MTWWKLCIALASLPVVLFLLGIGVLILAFMPPLVTWFSVGIFVLLIVWLILRPRKSKLVPDGTASDRWRGNGIGKEGLL